MAKSSATTSSANVGNAITANENAGHATMRIAAMGTERGEVALHRVSADFIQPWAESTSKMTSVAFDCCAEAIRFAGQRVERNRETVSHLPKCGSWEELMKLQMDWTSGLMQDYLEESRNFFEMAQKASADAVKRGNGRPEA